jgi:hypothetical protein
MSQTTQIKRETKSTLKATTPEHIRKLWPEKTEPMLCWHGCGKLLYLDRNVLSKSKRRITVEVDTHKKHQCPCYPASPEYDPNYPKQQMEMAEPEDSDKREDEEEGEEEE